MGFLLLLLHRHHSAGVLFFLDEKLHMVKHNRLQGQIAVVLPTVCPRSVGLIAGIFWMKSQSPHYSLCVCGGVGGGAVVTNDWLS